MSPPEIGELDKRVLVRRKQDRPGFDNDVETDLDAGVKAWARIEPTGSALFYGTQQVETTVTHRLTTWRTSELNANVIGGNHVVDHAGMRYRVRRVTDINGQRDFVLMDLEQQGAIPNG
jgi:head-tail adaptor